ncbi:MAG TPA: HEPN domain-containing protein [Gemmataceae bacterium]|nr:HEPN domain-containing protein [Gemmataceae bacterium]
MKVTTARWVRKAEADSRAAKRLSRGSDPLHDVVCFHCQQCAEKYLKALMEEIGLVVPKTHDLGDLLPALRPYHPSLGGLSRGLDFLTNFAVAVRYPDENASKRQAEAALRWAGRVRQESRSLLGIRPPRSPRKPPK